MPWTIDDVDKHIADLSDKQKEKWVRIANQALAACVENGGDDASCAPRAIRVANSQFSAGEVNWGSFQEITATDKFQLILPIGSWHHTWYGEFDITAEMCADMVANWKAKVLGERQAYIDTDHDGGGANGWIAELEAREDGLYARIEWTEPGKTLLKKGIYKYFSAEIGDHMDIHTGLKVKNVLIAATLTNRPFMNTMPQAHLREPAPERVTIPAHGDGASDTEEGEMKTLKEILEAIKELTLTDDDKKKIVEVAGISLEAPERKPDTAKLELAERVTKLEEQNATLKATNTQLSDAVTDLRAKEHAEKKVAVIGKALADGRIVPKDKEMWEKRFDKDAIFTTEILEGLPVVVDMSTRGNGDGGGEPVQLSANENEVHRQMNHSAEDIKEHGGDA